MPFEGDFSHAVGNARKRLTASSGSAQGEWKADLPTDAGTRATVERVVAAVVAVLEDRTYDEHAADESIWAETRDHLRIAVAEALAAQPSGLAERLRELHARFVTPDGVELCNACPDPWPCPTISLLAQEDR